MCDLYIIAEAGVNHNGVLDNAFKLVDIAVEAGANCVKFQAYTASELSVSSLGKADYQKMGDYDEESQFDMLKRYELSVEDFASIKQYCDGRNIDFLVTPFSPSWVNVFYNMGVNSFKIGSGNIKSLQLLKEIGKTGLPVFMSTGMSSMLDVNRAINVLEENGCKDISLLHCVSIYPTPWDKVNLFTIDVLKRRFNLRTGFSDHTTSIDMGALAVAAGASILEKHFTIDITMDGPDHANSLEQFNLDKYIRKAMLAKIACGFLSKPFYKKEMELRDKTQTSLVARVDIKSGSIIDKDMLCEKRPGNGISPMFVNRIIGMVANKDIKEDSIIKMEDLNG